MTSCRSRSSSTTKTRVMAEFLAPSGPKRAARGCDIHVTEPLTSPPSSSIEGVAPMAVVISIVVIALVFDFVNGFHDAANSIATVVSTRVLSPRMAVAWAAFFNFVAFLVFGTAVASTIAKGVVIPDAISLGVVFAGLIGAIGWSLITFYLGLPTSSSHALVGGMSGAAVAKAGWHVLETDGLRKIGVFIVLSPLIGLALGLIFTVVIMWTFHRVRNVDRLNRGFRTGQLVSAAAFSLGHGANDAQKTMGVILAVLIAEHEVPASSGVPL